MSKADWRKFKEIHLVSWNSISQGKEKSRLGIRRLDLLNRALLGKWLGGLQWRIILKGVKAAELWVREDGGGA